MASTNDLKNGMVLKLEGGQLWSVVEFQHVKPGKGPAFVRTKLKNVLSGKVVDKTFNAGVKVETATVDKRDMQFSYMDGDYFVFMDMETYDQLMIDRKVVGDAANFLIEGFDRHRRAARGRGPLRRAAGRRRADHPGDRAGRPGRPLHGRHQARHAGDRSPDQRPALHHHR
ncbi:Elongation factor P [Streptomyces tendae]